VSKLNLFKVIKNLVNRKLSKKEVILSMSDIEHKISIYKDLTNIGFKYNEYINDLKNKIETKNNIKIDSILLSITDYIECPEKNKDFNIESDSIIKCIVFRENNRNVLIIILASETLVL